jgi:hypothetical protein
MLSWHRRVLYFHICSPSSSVQVSEVSSYSIPFHSIPHLGFKYCGGKEKSTCTASCCCYKSNTCYSVNLQPPYSDITSDAQHQRPPQFFCHDKGENDLSFFSIHSKHWNRIAKFSCVISCRVHAKC